jgi:hypothetical protein
MHGTSPANAALLACRPSPAGVETTHLQVAPAKPDYMIERKAKEQQRKMEEKLAREEEKKDRELKQKIKQTEEKLQRRRVSHCLQCCLQCCAPDACNAARLMLTCSGCNLSVGWPW